MDKQKSGLATAGMVLGIIAIAGSWIPFLNIVSIIMAVLAIIFGGVALVQKRSVGKAIATVVLGVLTIIIAIVMMAAAVDSIDKAVTDDNEQKTSSSEQKKATERLTLDEGWTLDKSNQYMAKVIGTVSNNSDKPVNGYIQITFSALDAEGANVGDCLANANTVDANGKWKFEAVCSGSNIDTVRFKELSGF